VQTGRQWRKESQDPWKYGQRGGGSYLSDMLMKAYEMKQMVAKPDEEEEDDPKKLASREMVRALAGRGFPSYGRQPRYGPMTGEM